MRLQTPSETFTATTIDNILIRYDVTRKANTTVDAPLESCFTVFREIES